MITVNNLCKSFNGRLVLDHISFTVDKGTILGIIGENGVGKSTLLQCLAGIHLPESGNVTIDLENVWENEALKSQMGYVSDGTHLFQNYSVKEMSVFFKQVYPSFNEADFNRYRDIFQMPLNTKIAHLSKGMKTRLSLILHLAHHPRILILDEPTSGLDAIIKKQVLQCIIDEAACYQTTLIIASHHLNELEKLCDNIAFLHAGKLIRIDSVEAVKHAIQKIEVTFSVPPDSDLMTDPRWLAVEKIGSIYYFITRTNDPENQKLLLAHHGTHVTLIGLSLEEIFTYTNRQNIHVPEV